MEKRTINFDENQPSLSGYGSGDGSGDGYGY